MEWMAAIWFVLLVVFIWLEASTVAVVSVWFALGSLAAMIASICGGELWLQFVLFVAVSALFLLALRPLTKKYFTPRLQKTNIDSVVDAQGMVLEEIDNLGAKGRVKIGGIEWSARSTEGEKIPENTLVKVDRIEGVKVYVTAIKVTT